MKKFNNSFLLFLSLITMSYAISEGIYSQGNMWRVSDCFSTSLKVGPFVYSKLALSFCPSIVGRDLRQPITGDQTSGPRDLIDPNISCAGSPVFFCCAQIAPSITAGEFVTPTDLPMGKYYVYSVVCYSP